MMIASGVDWLARPVAAHLLRANFLFSSLIHPAQLQRWCAHQDFNLHDWTEDVARRLGALPQAVARVWHQRVSVALVQDLRLDPIAGPDEEGAVACLLPPPAFDRLTLHLGLAIWSVPLCRLISRADLAGWEEAIGAPALAFSRRMVPILRARIGLPSGVDAVLPASSEAPAQARALGAMVLARCFEAAPPAVGRRGLLRLPPDVDGPCLPPSLDPVEAAQALTHAVLEALEPEWCSHFPATH
jgi:hypothetical protein